MSIRPPEWPARPNQNQPNRVSPQSGAGHEDAGELWARVREALAGEGEYGQSPLGTASLITQLAVAYCASELPNHHERGLSRALLCRSRRATSTAILRHSSGHLSASEEKSVSLTRATRVGSAAITVAHRRATGSIWAISPTWSPAPRSTTSRPFTCTESCPLTIRKMSLSQSPWVMSTACRSNSCNVATSATSSARPGSRIRSE